MDMKGIKERKKKGGEAKRRGRERKPIEREKKEGRKENGVFSRRSNGRTSTVQELKSIHVTRATREYQNLGVSSNSKR